MSIISASRPKHELMNGREGHGKDERLEGGGRCLTHCAVHKSIVTSVISSPALCGITANNVISQPMSSTLTTKLCRQEWSSGT